jgi:two-component system, chemotaxis family, CheB/CheR fusion protein
MSESRSESRTPADGRSRDVHRAIVRLIQELEAIDWYDAPIGVVAVDVRGVILAWNGSAGEILGVREWEVLGSELLYLFNEEGRAELDRVLARAIISDVKSPPAVFERRTAEGQPQFVEVTACGLKSRTDEPGATVLLQDVTTRVVAERARADADRRFRSLVQGVDAIVWEGDPSGGAFRFVSQRAEEILGYPLAAWLDEPDFWERQIHEEDRGRTVAARRSAVAECRDHVLEYRMTARDGRVVWLRDNVTVTCDEQGRATRLLGLIVEITERKRTEQSLARLYRQAEEDIQRKDEFLAILSHELRTPLSAMTTALGVLDVAPIPEERSRQARAIIARQTAHLTRLMEELLDVSRIGSGKLTLDRRLVDLDEATQQSLETLASRIGERRHDIVVARADAPVTVMGDAVRIQQMVTNLVDNALKYTPAGGRITISIRRDGADAHLSVRDTGVGIAPDLLPRIFEPFYQRSVKHSSGGLGLGLTLVRRLAERHGGSVSAHSAGVGHGAEFIVRLPWADAPVAADTAPAPAARATRLILVIDDDADTREAMKMLLNHAGYGVELAEDGPRGIEAARAAEYDAIIIDIGLPGLEGHEVSRHLRARSGRRPFLIALTGYSQPEDRRRAEEAGFNAYLVKPVPVDELMRLLENLHLS